MVARHLPCCTRVHLRYNKPSLGRVIYFNQFPFSDGKLIMFGLIEIGQHRRQLLLTNVNSSRWSWRCGHGRVCWTGPCGFFRVVIDVKCSSASCHSLSPPCRQRRKQGWSSCLADLARNRAVRIVKRACSTAPRRHNRRKQEGKERVQHKRQEASFHRIDNINAFIHDKFLLGFLKFPNNNTFATFTRSATLILVCICPSAPNPPAHTPPPPQPSLASAPTFEPTLPRHNPFRNLHFFRPWTPPRMSLPAGQRLIAESNYEMHQSRDPYGALATLAKTNTRKVSVFHAWEPQVRAHSRQRTPVAIFLSST
jgi:hypothetical protein